MFAKITLGEGGRASAIFLRHFAEVGQKRKGGGNVGGEGVKSRRYGWFEEGRMREVDQNNLLTSSSSSSGIGKKVARNIILANCVNMYITPACPTYRTIL